MRVHQFGRAVTLAAAMLTSTALAGDEEIAQEVASRIVDSGKLTDYEVGVKVKGGVAWLSGRVRNQQQLDQAVSIAKSSPSVNKVIPRLKLGSSGKIRHAGPQIPAGGVERVSATSPSGAAAAQYCPPGAGMAGPIPVTAGMMGGSGPGGPMPMYAPGVGGGVAPATYDQPSLPAYAWPTYAAYPNYAAVTYPRQYSPTAWPYIGPFYPYPQVPLGWRKVTLEWDDGWWWLDFKQGHDCW